MKDIKQAVLEEFGKFKHTNLKIKGFSRCLLKNSIYEFFSPYKYIKNDKNNAWNRALHSLLFEIILNKQMLVNSIMN